MKFTSWPDVDVVPASLTWSDKAARKVKHFTIPDMRREMWIRTKPRLHAGRISTRASNEGPHFRQVIKMIKDWNRRQPVSMQSFHIEVIAQKMQDSFLDRSWAIHRWFEAAQDYMWSCMYEGEDVCDYLDYGATASIIDQLKIAERISGQAWYLTYGDRDDHEGAIKAWKSIFGQRFPSHG